MGAERTMGAGADDGLVGDEEGRGSWAAARRPENPGLRLPEVIGGQQTVHLPSAAATRRVIMRPRLRQRSQWPLADSTDMGLYSSPSVATVQSTILG